jgi:hypothetical protein
MSCYAVCLDSILQINNDGDAEYIEKSTEQKAPNFLSIPSSLSEPLIATEFHVTEEY